MSEQKFQSTKFRFVNNSPGHMTKPRTRMKPAFKVIKQDSQTLSSQISLSNKNSMVIEQTLDPHTSLFINTTDQKYLHQMKIKRPPGRPRKHPLGEPRSKRPQGRPRKYPVEVTGSTTSTNAAKTISDKSLKPKNDHNKEQGELLEHVDSPYPIDTELLRTGKKARGRPRKAHEMKEEDVAAAAVLSMTDPKLSEK